MKNGFCSPHTILYILHYLFSINFALNRKQTLSKSTMSVQVIDTLASVAKLSDGIVDLSVLPSLGLRCRIAIMRCC